MVLIMQRGIMMSGAMFQAVSRERERRSLGLGSLLRVSLSQLARLRSQCGLISGRSGRKGAYVYTKSLRRTHGMGVKEPQGIGNAAAEMLPRRPAVHL
jgi:hypothetical protein